MTIYSKINEYNIKEANKDHDKASGGIIKLQKQILESRLNIFPKSKLSSEKYFKCPLFYVRNIFVYTLVSAGFTLRKIDIHFTV